MNFTVLWRQKAEDQLTILWTEGPDRNAIAAAAEAIDAMLRRDPQTLGESRDGFDRLLFHAPLTALFEVREQDRLVYVKEVGRWPSQR